MAQLENASKTVPSGENVIELNEFTLEECFRSIIDGNSLELDLDNLNNILKVDLHINFILLKPKVKYVIPYMLVHFIKSWPGWQKSSSYINKQITFESWFAKFKEYLVFKINYLVKNDFEKALVLLKTSPPIDESILFKIDNSTQTELTPEKLLAPFSIEMRGVPKILNSLIFCEGDRDSILVKEHKANSFEDRLSTKQLINWPYIEVEYKSKDIHFVRRNMHEYDRYLMFSSEKITFKKPESFIEEVEIINSDVPRTAYTLNVMKEYCTKYVSFLKKHQEIVGLQNEDLNNIDNILKEFLEDISDLNMNSIATNTSIIFNIGHSMYARNKCVRTSNHGICFAESITPKINTLLYEFSAIKDPDSLTPFQHLEAASNSTDIEFLRSFLPNIKYKCTFCAKVYKQKLKIFVHFKEKHCMEQPVLCFKCKSQMDVATLTANRWYHQCGGSAVAGENSSSR